MDTLDRVVLMYNGVWPEFDWESHSGSQNAIVETIQRWYDDAADRYVEVGEINKGGTSLDREYCKVVCTKEQFEQRALELNKEKQMTDWYDYEKKQMVSLPPVGEIVLADADEGLIKVKLLEHTNNGVSDIAVCRVINDYCSNLGKLGYYHRFKPLDWEKDVRKDKLIDKAVQIMYDNACATKGELINGVKRLYDLGYLKFPEEK